VFATQRSMAEKSLEERIAALEAQSAHKPIEEHFDEQGELIDRVFVYRLEECDRKSEARLESRLKPLRHDLAFIKHAVGVLLTRLT
jgi:hypothetical protein